MSWGRTREFLGVVVVVNIPSIIPVVSGEFSGFQFSEAGATLDN